MCNKVGLGKRQNPKLQSKQNCKKGKQSRGKKGKKKRGTSSKRPNTRESIKQLKERKLVKKGVEK